MSDKHWLGEGKYLGSKYTIFRVKGVMSVEVDNKELPKYYTDMGEAIEDALAVIFGKKKKREPAHG